MSGWRAGLVAAAVGGLILLVGAIVNAAGGDGGSLASTTTAAPGDVTLACVPALKEVCADLGASLGVATRTFRSGGDPGDDVVVLAPAADLPAGMTGAVVARSPVAVAVWRERAVVLAPACGGAVDLACLAGAYGKQWGDLGGNAAWAAFTVGLADPALSASGLEAWRAVAGAGVPRGLKDSLRVRAADDAALMLEMAQFGPSRADAVVTTEVAVAGQLENVWDVGRLEVYYPDPAPWVEYLAAASGGDARRLAERLLSAEVQSLLAARGLRPASGEATGLPEGLGTPGQPLGPLGPAEREALLAAWQSL
ncbi:MAG: substrate-binding domain-containing protein [Actinomycetota bacterium]